MPTTFANTINGNEILAKRAQCDYAGADIQTTYATKTEVTTGLAGKENTISDLAAIRSGAQAGSTAVQPGDLAAVATTGAYSDLTGTPTIPSGAQLVPAATSADADKVLTVDAQGTPAWSTPAAGGVTDVEVNGTSVVNASGVAEVTVPAQVNADWNSSSGASEILNKPTIPTATSDLTNNSGFITLSDVPAQVNADWNAVSGAAEILNKPTIPAAQVNSDWNASSGVAEILNKPTILPYKPVVAGTGVRIVDDTANNRIVVEADETELLDTPQSSSTSPMTLNETVANFERIKVYGYWHYNGTQRIDACVEFPGSVGSFSLSAFGCRNTTANVSGFYTCSVAYTVSGTTITVVKALREVIPSEENLSYSDSLKVTRVVGINRIQGGA